MFERSADLKFCKTSSHPSSETEIDGSVRNFKFLLLLPRFMNFTCNRMYGPRKY